MGSKYFGRRRDFGNKKMMENAEERQRVNAEIQGKMHDETFFNFSELELDFLANEEHQKRVRDLMETKMYSETGIPECKFDGAVPQRLSDIIRNERNMRIMTGADVEDIGKRIHESMENASKSVTEFGNRARKALESVKFLGNISPSPQFFRGDLASGVGFSIARAMEIINSAKNPIWIDTECTSGWDKGTPTAKEMNDYYMGIDWAREGGDFTGYYTPTSIPSAIEPISVEKLREIANEFKDVAGLDISVEPFKSSVENRFDGILRDMAKSALLKAETKWKYQDFSDLSNTQRHCIQQLLSKGKDRQAEQMFMSAYKKMWIEDPMKQGMEKLITELKTITSDVRFHVKPVAGCRLPNDHIFDDSYLGGVTNIPIQAESAKDLMKFETLKSRNRDILPQCMMFNMESLMFYPVQGRVDLAPEPFNDTLTMSYEFNEDKEDKIYIHDLGDSPRISRRAMNNMNGAKLNGVPTRKWVVILGDFENPMCLRWIHGVNPDEAIVNWAMATDRFNSALDVDKRTFHTMRISVYSPKMFKKEAKRHEQLC